MQIKEMQRLKKEQTGETVVDIEAGRLRVRLINTYNNERLLDEIIYTLACRRFAERMA